MYDVVGDHQAAMHYLEQAAGDSSDFEARNNLGAVLYDNNGNYEKNRAKQYVEEASVLEHHPIVIGNLKKIISHE